MNEILIELNEIERSLEGSKKNSIGLFFTKNKEQVKSALKNKKEFREFAEQIKKKSEEAANTPIPEVNYSDFMLFLRNGDRKKYDTVYSEKRTRLNALALCLLVDLIPSNERQNYIEALEDHIWNICNEPTWCLPAHLNENLFLEGIEHIYTEVDMNSCETAFALSEVTTILKNELSFTIKQKAKVEVENRVLNPFFHSKKKWYWESYENNWSSVCATSITIASIYCLEDTKKIAKIIKRLLKSFEAYLSGFTDDGGCREGLAYWRYGFSYFVYFIEAMKEISGNKINLYKKDFIKKIAKFPSVVNLSKGKVFNFSDSLEEIPLHTGAITKISENLSYNHFPIQRLSNFSDDSIRWGHCSRNLFWSNADVLNSNVEDDEKQYYLPKLQISVNKMKVNNQIIAVGMKGGSNNEPHNHNDLGHYIVHLTGENILSDLGMGEYSKNYFSDKRYESIFTSSAGHSVPIINGYKQSSGEASKSNVLYYKKEQNNMDIGYDISSAYRDPNLISFSRHFKWRNEDNKGNLDIEDRFKFKTEYNSVEERIVSTFKPTLIRKGLISWKNGAFSLSYNPSYKVKVDTIQTKNKLGDLKVYILRLFINLKNKQMYIQYSLSARATDYF